MPFKINVLFKNIASLFVVQFFNYIAAIILIPFYIRILGVENYGLIAFAQSMMYYFILVTDYGFNISAVQDIAKNDSDAKEISRISSSIFLIKGTLTIFCFLLLLFLVFTFEKFSKNYNIYLLFYLMVLGNALFPVWFFQGIQKMKIISIANILGKGIAIIAIFIFVEGPKDLIKAVILQTSGWLFTGTIGFIYMLKKYRVELIIPERLYLIKKLKEGWHLFISLSSVTLYTTSNIFILGLLTNNLIVGYFSSAEKIIRACQQLIVPISNGLLPVLGKTIETSKKKTIDLLGKSLKFSTIIFFIISILVFIFAEQISKSLFGNTFKQVIVYIKIMSLVPFASAISHTLGIQGMVSLGFNKELSSIFIEIGVISITLIFLLVYLMGGQGAAICVLTIEFYFSYKTVHFLKKKNLLPLFQKQPEMV